MGNDLILRGLDYARDDCKHKLGVYSLPQVKYEFILRRCSVSNYGFNRISEAKYPILVYCYEPAICRDCILAWQLALP